MIPPKIYQLKLVYVLPLLLIPLFIPLAFASPLELTALKGEASGITLDMGFGHDDIRVLPNGKFIEKATLDYAQLDLYGDIINLSDSEIRVTQSGQNFRLINYEYGVMMFGHYNEGPQTHSINIYFATDNGLKKNTVTTAFNVPDDKVIEVEPEPEAIIEPAYDDLQNPRPVLGFAYAVEDPVYIQNDFTAEIRAYNDRILGQGLNTSLGGLADVNIKIDLEQNKTELIFVNERTIHEQIIEDEWELIHSFDGSTNRLGDYVGAKLMTSGVFESKQWMRVTITATWEDQVVTEQFKIWVTEVGAR
jgi:hypothetical protein